MLAQKNPDIDNAITTMFTLSNDSIIKEQMQAREDYYTTQRSLSKLIEDQQKEIADQQKEIENQHKEIADQQKGIENQHKEIADQQKEIADLKAQLAEAKKS